MTTTTHASEHLSYRELCCFNRLGVPYREFASGRIVRTVPIGGLVASYPSDWRGVGRRAERLGQAFELARSVFGRPITPLSAYRPVLYNAAAKGEAGSWHIQGMALDLPCPKGQNVQDWYDALVRLAQTAEGSMIRGIGLNTAGNALHIDVRPSPDILVVWAYERGRPINAESIPVSSR